MKASVTIESSIIYPLIIFISVLLVMHAFYMHDKLVITADMYRVLMEDVAQANSTSKIPDSISDINERLSNKCMLSHSFTISFNEKNNELKLNDDNNYTTNMSFKNYERCDFIRKYYTILTLIRKDD